MPLRPPFLQGKPSEFRLNEWGHLQSPIHLCRATVLTSTRTRSLEFCGAFSFSPAPPASLPPAWGRLCLCQEPSGASECSSGPAGAPRSPAAGLAEGCSLALDFSSCSFSQRKISQQVTTTTTFFFFFCYGTDNLGGGLVYVSWYPIEMHPNSLLLSVLFLGLWAAFWSKMGDSGLALAPGVGVERLRGGLQLQTCWYVPA